MEYKDPDTHINITRYDLCLKNIKNNAFIWLNVAIHLILVLSDYVIGFCIMFYGIISRKLFYENEDYILIVIILFIVYYIIFTAILHNIKTVRPNNYKPSFLCYKFESIKFIYDITSIDRSWKEKGKYKKTFYYIGLYATWIYLLLTLIPIQVIGTMAYSIYKLDKFFVFSSYLENQLRTFFVGILTSSIIIFLVILIYGLIKLYFYMTEVVDKVKIMDETEVDERVQV